MRKGKRSCGHAEEEAEIIESRRKGNAEEEAEIIESLRKRAKRREIDTDIIEAFLRETLTTMVPSQWNDLELEIMRSFLQDTKVKTACNNKKK